MMDNMDGDSVIPGWVLSQVAHTRDRASFQRHTRNVGIYCVLGSVLAGTNFYPNLFRNQFAWNLSGLWAIAGAILHFGPMIFFVKNFLDRQRVCKWLDENNAWSELVNLQIDNSADELSRKISDPSVSRKVPTWVTVLIFSLIALGFVALWFS
jgi:hypothetical protein